MISGITLPFRIATMAVRHNADLRREISAMRATAQAVKALQSVNAGFPSALLGGELLGIMSAQLKELLQQGNPVAETPYIRSRHGKFGTSESIDIPSRPWNGVRSEDRWGGSFKAPDAVKGQVLKPQSSRNVETRNTSAATDQVESMTRKQASWKAIPTEDGLETAWREGTAIAAGIKKEIEPVGSMARQLREYFEMERRQSAIRAASENVQQVRTVSSATAVAASQQPETSKGLSQKEKQAALAQRLRAFVSGSGPGSQVQPGLWKTGEQTISEISSLRESSMSSPAGMRAPEFAERLADILHEQAAQHGIDLT